MTTAEILNAAADLIEPDGAWTQGRSARDHRGFGVEATNGAAVCWCLDGALRRVSSGDWKAHDEAFDLLELRLRKYPVYWNDYRLRNQAEVVQALRDAAMAAS